ncbi:MAG: hypothetical protein V8Q42_04030 [Anaerovoracaceae bacterium]
MKRKYKSGGLFENMTAEDIAYSMLNGEPLFDSGKIMKNLRIFSLWKYGHPFFWAVR